MLLEGAPVMLVSGVVCAVSVVFEGEDGVCEIAVVCDLAVY